MLKTFLSHYLELPPKTSNITCLGGGVGTAQILKGLRKLPVSLTAVVSMADDGGSAGRLRRAFSVPPSGDIVNCLAALSDEESIIRNLFLYRFSGKRTGKDTDLEGQKLGNLIFVALSDMYNDDTSKALEELSKIIATNGKVLPATTGNVNIWAKNTKGKKIYGEQNIDLGKYNGTKSLSEVHLNPPNIKAYKPTIDAIRKSDLIICGPGDLFSTVLPVLLVPQIKNILKNKHVPVFFIVNIANKPFETPNFKVSDYLTTIEKHMEKDIFDKIFINTNNKPKISSKLKYHYVNYDKNNLQVYKKKIIEGDFISEKMPLYHDSNKIAQTLKEIAL